MIGSVLSPFFIVHVIRQGNTKNPIQRRRRRIRCEK